MYDELWIIRHVTAVNNKGYQDILAAMLWKDTTPHSFIAMER